MSSLLPSALHDVLEEHFLGFFLLFNDEPLERKTMEEDLLQCFLGDVSESVESILWSKFRFLFSLSVFKSNCLLRFSNF